ncbi:protein phosphatase 2c, putative [Ichthyophthirius multifiliis]|uniref:Protein phosphatase 2c, putative n=1 Tax=Ichthyophthirius multifiliis TaxID=5932 RepID=G0R3K9_ICHMU|nr:protein phosphatase 2c, putative [Ichthyophthirius multifiliis]EGR27946.1 protein phosphatase 2c, putative [Ichthyophthirius multifiliis]|eukprot:XP_004027291.1 protein phosphatase 2c, putative [Ichthyophthirius multifiliis]
MNSNKIYTANTGDSRAFIASTIEGEWKVKELSKDHKPDDEKEKQRILQNGGRVDFYKNEDSIPIGPYRVWLKHENVPGLAMSRSFGDKVASSVCFLMPCFLFIENTFYNNQYNIDIKNLCKDFLHIRDENESQELLYKSKTLNEVFEDIKIQIGKPYVYRHGNQCDHMIVFNQIRMWNTDLPQDKDLYALNYFLPKIKRRKCEGCLLYFADIVCFNDKISNKNPVYFCEKCYKEIHLDDNQKLKYNDFSYYPYLYE